MTDSMQKYERMIFDTCDVLAEKVFQTFLLFVSICVPTTDEHYEAMLFDSMEVWDCI